MHLNGGNLAIPYFELVTCFIDVDPLIVNSIGSSSPSFLSSKAIASKTTYLH